ncbi:ABC transporter substrate-binding protein [Tengunoibacter tsumagoiensis]|uniref:Putative ABC transporter substrate-binding lipoprotein YvrC n=1 Tax=Tengunoibacter tsumagoiensis TaxID=2014871 RepID=A0A401ZYR0_9CHLR|nr:ABC transporter substrate-binding protein [Tengunoibacter tsumagoiensis]GCE11981.1 putative ABC transporter substrate-binding lipoprotein YvrC [Tengunoibacter tsumagoiensis]
MRTHVISSRLALIFLMCCLFTLVACGTETPSSTTTTPQVTADPGVDAYGTPIVIPQAAPQRIIALAPSVSETLAALGLQDRVVGVDYNTDYPAEMAKIQKISDINGSYNVEAIVALHPDLILSAGKITKEYDTKLGQVGLHVISLPSANFAKSIEQIHLVGQLTHTESKAMALVKDLEQQVQKIKAAVKGASTPRVLLEIDDSTPGKPYVFGGDSFGDEMLQDANGTNIFHADAGYPQVSEEAIIGANPQYIVLTEDPMYGGDPQGVLKRPNWGGIAAVKDLHVYRINANIMQRPGPRLVEGLRCLAQTIHPDKFTEKLPDYCTATV